MLQIFSTTFKETYVQLPCYIIQIPSFSAVSSIRSLFTTDSHVCYSTCVPEMEWTKKEGIRQWDHTGNGK